MTNASGRNETLAILGRVLVSLLAVGAVAALFVFRSLDDNRLVSWRWVFARTSPARLYGLALAGVVAANLWTMLRLRLRMPAVLLFVSSYAVAASFWGEPETIVDASRYFTQAKQLEIHGISYFLAQWGKEVHAWTDLPLVPLLYGLVFEVFGESRIYIEALTTLLFAATVVSTYRIGSRLWDDETGIIAGTLLLAMPYLLVQVPSMLVDVPTMLFLTLALLASVEAARSDGAARILIAAVTVVFAVFSKYSTWIMLPVIPAVWIVHAKEGKRVLRSGAIVALVSAALAAAVMLAYREVFTKQVALLFGYQAPGLRRWGESFVSTFLFQVHPFVTAGALLSIWIALRKRDARFFAVALPVLFLTAMNVKRSRYWIPALPMLALMAAQGLRIVKGTELRKLVLACAVISSIVVARFFYLPFLGGMSAVNLMKAGEYLDGLEEEQVEVYARSEPDSVVNQAVSVPILDLFTRKKLVYHYEPLPLSLAKRRENYSLRFTWEYVNPDYYEQAAEPGAAVAVISGGAGLPLPDALVERLRGHRLARSFTTSEHLFQHQMIVEVYRAIGRE